VDFLSCVALSASHASASSPPMEHACAPAQSQPRPVRRVYPSRARTPAAPRAHAPAQAAPSRGRFHTHRARQSTGQGEISHSQV